MQPALGHQTLCKEDILARIRVLILNEYRLRRHPPVEGDAGHEFRLRLLPHLTGNTAKTAGKNNIGSKSLKIQLGAPVGHPKINTAQHEDTVAFRRSMMHVMIIPQFSGFYKYFW